MAIGSLWQPTYFAFVCMGGWTEFALVCIRRRNEGYANKFVLNSPISPPEFIIFSYLLINYNKISSNTRLL